MPKKDLYAALSVGELARRSGTTVATLHFYESRRLIASVRTSGNQRRYERHMLRRVAIIRTAQRVGISLAAIAETLAELPMDRKATVEEWSRMSDKWRADLQERIAAMMALKDQLVSCIGCGCLSLQECPLRNAEDRLGQTGQGPVLIERSIARALSRNEARSNAPTQANT